MAYVTGDTVQLTCTFTVDGGSPTAPDTQSLKVKDPSGNVDASYGGFTKPSTGVYSKNLTLDEAGVWHYRWEGSNRSKANSSPAGPRHARHWPPAWLMSTASPDSSVVCSPLAHGWHVPDHERVGPTWRRSC